VVAFTFPGQGTQRPGMGGPWAEHPSWELVGEVSETAGRDVAHLLLHAEADELRATRNAQLATFTLSLVVLDGDHLQNRVLAGERDERVPPRRKPFAERDTPFRGDLARRRRKARRNLAGDAPGCVGQPRALPAGHRRRRSARSTERARGS